MSKTKWAAALVGVCAVFALTGCGDDGQAERDYELEQIELGKACYEAGGEWDYNAWNGYVCEFGGD